MAEMNRRLSIYFTADYLIAGMQPFNEFRQLASRGMKRFGFYFLIDPQTGRIDFGEQYRTEFENRNPNVFGNWIERILDPDATIPRHQQHVPCIDLLDLIVAELRELYLAKLEEHASSVEVQEKIPLFLSFADNVSGQARQKVRNFLENHEMDVRSDASIPAERYVASLCGSGPINPRSQFIMLEALGNDLQMSHVNGEMMRKQVESFPGFGTDPRIGVIARYMVDQVNATTHRLVSESEIELETLRQIPLAEATLKDLQSTNRPFTRTTLSFAIEPNVDRNVIVTREDIEQATNLQIRNLTRQLENFIRDCGLRVEEVSKIIAIGPPFSNDKLNTELERYGKDRLQVLTEEQETLVLKGLMVLPDPRSGFTATGREPGPVSLPPPVVPHVVPDQLQIGQKVRLRTNNNDGKGEAVEEFQYSGNNSFLVLASSRGTLMPNDFVRNLTPAWVPSLSLEFELFRNGQRFPNPNTIYSTRKLLSIEFF